MHAPLTETPRPASVDAALHAFAAAELASQLERLRAAVQDSPAGPPIAAAVELVGRARELLDLAAELLLGASQPLPAPDDAPSSALPGSAADLFGFAALARRERMSRLAALLQRAGAQETP
jgi:hypothetical protein